MDNDFYETEDESHPARSYPAIILVVFFDVIGIGAFISWLIG